MVMELMKDTQVHLLLLQLSAGDATLSRNDAIQKTLAEGRRYLVDYNLIRACIEISAFRAETRRAE